MPPRFVDLSGSALLIKQILSPPVVRAAHQSHDVTTSVQIKRVRLAHQLHSSFGGHLISLAAVTRMAAGYQVLPAGRAATRTRYHMVQSQIARGQKFTAVLAGVPITQQNILSRERPRLMRNAAIFQQANHRWHTQRQPWRMQKVTVLSLGHGDTL